MEDPVDEWENEQYPASGSGEERVSQSMISRILSGGLWLGKKFVITGFFVSSAPVVLPPLLVMSALGFAVSIPFGAVLAGYTCTEKLMSKLLPMPQSSGMLDYEEQPRLMDRAEEDEGRFPIEEEKKQIHDSKESVEMRIELAEDGNNKEQKQEDVMPEMDPNGDRNVKPEAKSKVLAEGPSIREKSQDKKLQPVVTRVVVAKPVEGEIESSSGKSEETEVLKAESTGLLEKIRDEDHSGESAQMKKKKNKERLKKSLGLGGKKEDKSAKNTKQTEKNPEILHKNVNKVAAGTGKTDEISSDAQNRNIEISGVLDDRGNAAVVESRSIMINGNQSDGKPREKQAGHGPEMQSTAAYVRHEGVPVESNTIHRDSTGNRVPYRPEAAEGTNEISPSEEKSLWDQINAMRAIVGYKMEHHHPTITEELKALYVFTGVEPPSSFKDLSDIKDSQEKLRFLMSIVGVK